MSQIQQILNYVKQINERLNLWASNAKKAEELPVMDSMNPNGLLIVSELEAGIWKSKQLEIQKIIDGISLDGQDNKIREALLGTITDVHDLNYLLDNNGITVAENEIIVLTVLTTIDLQVLQRQFLWKKGKGSYNPIGSSNINDKLIELQPKFINEIIANELTSSPSAIVYDFGVITGLILDVLNSADPARNYTDSEKIYYIRATKDGVSFLYNFIGANGTYGNGASQMINEDLVLVYSSSSTDLTSLIYNKLDKGTYTGNAGLLDGRISVIESLQNLHTNLAGYASVVWTGTGLVFDVIYPDYYIQGVLFPGATLQKTLDTADPDDPREDVFILDTTGCVVKKGIASPDPAPYVVDSETEIYLTTIPVGAGATTPTGFLEKVAYKENAEFTTFTNSGAITFNATASPFQGTYHIDCTSFTAGHTMKFTETPLSSITDFANLNFRVNLKAVFTNTARFYVRFMKDGIISSSTLEVVSGSFNFNRNTVNIYQQVVIPMTAFSFTNASFNGIEIFMLGSNASGFRMDNIVLSTGSGTTSPLQKAIASIATDSGVANATVNDDTFTFKGLGGLVVSALGKVISFTADLTNYYTKSEIDSKISDLNKYKGKFLTFSALVSALPTGSAGESAQVNEVGSTDVVNYSWDDEENIWVQSGSAGSGATDTDMLPEGSSNLYFTTARVLATLLSGLSLATGGQIVSTDSVLVAFGKIQKQINDLINLNEVSPNKFTGTDTQKIQAALDFAVTNNKTLRINKNESTGLDLWDIEEAILLKSNSKILIDNVTLKLTNTSRDNIFRTENCGFGLTTPASNPLQNISIIGIGNAILEGADNPRATGDSSKTLSLTGIGFDFSYGSDTGVVGQSQTGDWRNIGILMTYTTNIEVSGLNYINMHAWCNSFERCKNINIHDLIFSSVKDRTISGVGVVECKNLDGVDLRLGCSIINVQNISGYTDDDVVACSVLSIGTSSAGEYNTMEVTGSVYSGDADAIHDVYINNITASTFNNNIRLLSTGNTKMFNITVENIKDTSTGVFQDGATIVLGSNSGLYGGTSPLGNFNNIHIRNVVNRFATNAIVLKNLISESSFSNIYQPSGTPLNMTTGNRELSISNIMTTSPTVGVPSVELIASVINSSSVRSGIFSDANNLSYFANMAWRVSTETNLNNYQYSGFNLTPSSGLTNLPTGWVQQRYSMINVGTDNNSFRGQILLNGTTGDMAYRASPSGGTFTPWIIIPKIVTNTTTTALTLANLNSAYPNAYLGFKVHCISISGGALIYEKTSTGWVSYSISVVV